MTNPSKTDHVHIDRPKPWRILTGAIMALLLLFTTQSSLIPAANAATQARITSIQFGTNSMPNGSIQSISANFNIEPQATTPTTLRIDFPSELAGLPDSFPILENPNDPSSQIGSCVVTSSGIDCTFTDAFILANQAGANGQVGFEVRVTISETTTTEKTFDFGGIMTPPVSIYPPSGPCQVDCDFPGQGASKSGNYFNEGEIIQWAIRVPSPADGMPVGQQVIVTDNFDPAIYELTEDPWIYEARDLYLPSSGGGGWHPGWGGRLPADRSTITDEGRTITFTTGPGLPSSGDRLGLTGSLYMVIFEMRVLDEGRAGTYTNTANITIAGSDPTTLPGTVTRQSGSGTAVGVAFGKFAITKSLSGETPTNTPNTFTLNWEITNPADPDEQPVNGTTQLTPGEIFYGPEIKDGYRVVVTETALDATQFPDGAWEPGTFTPTDSDGVPLSGATPNTLIDTVFSAAEGNLGQLSFFDLNNTFTPTPDYPVSSFTIQKIVNGAAANLVPENTEYEINYSYPAGDQYPAGNGSVQVQASGTPTTITDIPVGAVVTITETTPAPITGATWGTPVITPETFTVTDGEEVDVTVTNTVTPIPTPVIIPDSSFTIQKIVNGAAANLVPENTEYEINYSYPAGDQYPAGNGSVQVLASGTPTTITDIPVGAVVTITETTPAPITGATWGTPVITPATFTVTDGEEVDVTVTNTVTPAPVPPVPVTTPEEPVPATTLERPVATKAHLAATGGTPWDLVSAGAAFSLLVGLLIVTSRRSKGQLTNK